ncbi:MAG: hypothetical protein M0P13_03170 [Fibrobacteraceae bacterium]|nr:hypothetical protein [Fibrobacteraceae bacterium]
MVLSKSEEIKNEMTDAKIKFALKQWLLSKKYDSKDIDTAFSEIEIFVKGKKQKSTSNDGKSKKVQTIQLCRVNSLYPTKNTTYASLNSGVDSYWANPRTKCLEKDWWLLLNDTEKKRLHVFKIPAGDIKRHQVIERTDKPGFIDIQIRYSSSDFEDGRSHVKFKKWLVQTIQY